MRPLMGSRFNDRHKETSPDRASFQPPTPVSCPSPDGTAGRFPLEVRSAHHRSRRSRRESRDRVPWRLQVPRWDGRSTPQAFFPRRKGVSVVNRGIPGNRIRLDAPKPNPSWGRAGVVSIRPKTCLGTNGVTHVVIAYNSNDWVFLVSRPCRRDAICRPIDEGLPTTYRPSPSG